MTRTTRSAFLFLTTALIASFSACSKTHSEFSYAEESCAIYRSVFSGFADKVLYLKSETVNSDNGLHEKDPFPIEWLDELKSPDCEAHYPDMEKMEECHGAANFKYLYFDASNWSQPIFDTPSVSLMPCKVGLRPELYQGSLLDFARDESIQIPRDIDFDPYAIVTSIAFSPDRNNAIFILEYPNSIGYILLLEKNENDWIHIGTSLGWMS